MEIQGGRFTLGALAEQYFARSAGARVAFVVDTLWSAAVCPELARLARRAARLSCDRFYAAAQAKEAARHKHMTAPQAAELAKLAKADQLILIHFAARYRGRYERLVGEAAAVFPNVIAEF